MASWLIPPTRPDVPRRPLRVAKSFDQPDSIAALTLAVCQTRSPATAYIPGLVILGATELYPGEAKTDTRDSYVLADTARTHVAHVRLLEPSDAALNELRVLSGYNDDLAADATPQANPLRDALTTPSPPLERVPGPHLEHAAVRPF